MHALIYVAKCVQTYRNPYNFGGRQNWRIFLGLTHGRLVLTKCFCSRHVTCTVCGLVLINNYILLLIWCWFYIRRFVMPELGYSKILWYNDCFANKKWWQGHSDILTVFRFVFNAQEGHVACRWPPLISLEILTWRNLWLIWRIGWLNKITTFTSSSSLAPLYSRIFLTFPVDAIWVQPVKIARLLTHYQLSTFGRVALPAQYFWSSGLTSSVLLVVWPSLLYK